MAEHYQLKCRECGKFWGNQARSFCDECLSPLEVVYDLDAIRPIFTRKNIEAGPTNLWRYSALLPLPEGYQGTIPAGTRLVQDDLCARFGTSRIAWMESSTGSNACPDGRD